MSTKELDRMVIEAVKSCNAHNMYDDTRFFITKFHKQEIHKLVKTINEATRSGKFGCTFTFDHPSSCDTRYIEKILDDGKFAYTIIGKQFDISWSDVGGKCLTCNTQHITTTI